MLLGTDTCNFPGGTGDDSYPESERKDSNG